MTMMSNNPNNYQHLKLHQDQHTIIWLTLDVHNKGANILTPEVLAEIMLACKEVQQQKALGMVFCSAKANGFIAGADIERFKQIPTLSSEHSPPQHHTNENTKKAAYIA